MVVRNHLNYSNPLLIAWSNKKNSKICMVLKTTFVAK